MIEWIWPWMLLLLPLPWLVRRLVPAATSQKTAVRAPFFQEWRYLSQTQPGRSTGGRLVPVISLWLFWTLLLLAAA